MSVFSIIRRGRQQAKEQQAQQAEKVRRESIAMPYKHVPTHAAVDAMAGAPPGWRADDKSRIQEENRKRSARTANGAGMPQLPRVNSSLSYVSYPSGSASPVANIPRTYSHSSMPQAWHERNGDVVYTHPMSYGSPAGSIKGKERERLPMPRHMVASSRTSVASGKGGSPITSVTQSSSSDDDLEIRPAPIRSLTGGGPPNSMRPRPSRHHSTESGYSHRLHPAHQRKISEESQTESVDRHYPPVARSSAYSTRSSRRSSSADDNVPPVPSLPVMQASLANFTATHSHSVSSASSSASCAGGPSTARSSVTSNASYSMHSKSGSRSTAATSSAETSPTLGFDFDLSPTKPGFAPVPVVGGFDPELTPVPTPGRPENQRRLSNQARSAEMDSMANHFDNAFKISDNTIRPTTNKTAIPADIQLADFAFDDPIITPTAAPVPHDGKKRLSKSPPMKPLPQAGQKKTRRWSFLGSKPTSPMI